MLAGVAILAVVLVDDERRGVQHTAIDHVHGDPVGVRVHRTQRLRLAIVDGQVVRGLDRRELHARGSVIGPLAIPVVVHLVLVARGPRQVGPPELSMPSLSGPILIR